MALAVDTALDATEKMARSSIAPGAWATVFGGMAVMIALILILAWAAKRLRSMTPYGASPLQVLGGVSVGPRERVLLVEVEGVRLVLGVAPGRVQTLHVITAPRDDFADALTTAMREEQRS